MGCATSKLDDLPAVVLCRERCDSLDHAVLLRYSLSNHHLSYFVTLSSLSQSFPSFFPNLPHSDLPPSSPPKPKPILPPAASSSAPAPRHSRSGSHIDFDGSEDSDSDSGHIHDDSDYLGPLHLHDTDKVPQLQHFPGDAYLPPGLGGFLGQGGFFHMNYMRNNASTPSVVFQRRPVGYQTVQFGEASSSSSGVLSSGHPPFLYQSNSSPYPDNAATGGGGGVYPNYGYGKDGISGGYYGNSSLQQSYGAPAKAPPPPPSPPRASTWDFLNPFESYEKYYPAYTPSRDSRELREEEGIPDLEDEHEAVKEVHGNPKFVGLGKNQNHARKGMVMEEEDEDEDEDEDEFHQKVDSESSTYQARLGAVSVSNNEGDNDGLEYEVHVVDQKVVDGEGRSGQGGGGAARGSRSVAETVAAIEIQFRRASECGSEVARMLEVGKSPYNRKYRVAKSVALKVSASKGALLASSAEDADQARAADDEQLGMKSGNLSSTLQKLLLWEKKLYNEVKTEERMRVVHDRNVQKLKRLDERGAEAHKVDATRTLIQNLSTKITMAIQVVDRISVTVNKIRDEELWPQINELIEGLSRMWKSLHDCHRDQCQVVMESKNQDSILSLKKLGDGHLEATLQFQRELIDWTFGFANWASTQKGFVSALNGWLLKCLLYEPEDTADGRVPFSPGRIGAPPIFVICHQWSQSMEKISEKEVVSSMYAFATAVLQFWERGKLEMHNRSSGNKDLEKIVKNLDKEDQKIQKQIQALEKTMVHVSGDIELLVSETGKLVYQSDVSQSNTLNESLQRTFKAMERFAMDSMKVYEELLQRCKEEGLSLSRNHGS
ncbi:hypothetical protein MLD38_032271 [Melastoma candidum]|uniref:Uncharacterized protein n=1 Tax=Melastoma candidum TaxID=119954 RepID=A0ACB9M7D4_9MYRT|nr:hypothetical protein MLD38_032271 [Melastoma candidum]